MQTRIHPRFDGRKEVAIAEEILRSCVHCGFCNATCPTYQELGDERDGPRGRIYLIKQFLESGDAGAGTRHHLDRCLTCRSCETTCPAGVQYGRLADIGRHMIEDAAPRPFVERALRRLLRWLVPWPRRFAPLLYTGQAVRRLLPRRLRDSVPERRAAGPRPSRRHSRKVILLGGCVQSVATPRTNAAAARVLDRLGIEALELPGAGCCGALSHHLAATSEARDFIRRNLDAWAAALDSAEAVISCSSGCGAMLKDYGFLMRDDPDYAGAARLASAKTRDLAEVLAGEDLSPLDADTAAATALHYPCTLTHALHANAALRQVLEQVGVQFAATREDHLCCGSAGTYSLLQPELSGSLKARKLDALSGGKPERIVTANVGCQLHLASAARVPVRHWIEIVDGG